MKLIFFFSVVVLFQVSLTYNVDLDEYKKMFFDCYVEFKKQHWHMQIKHHINAWHFGIFGNIKFNNPFHSTYESFYHPTGGIYHNLMAHRRHDQFHRKDYYYHINRNYHTHQSLPAGLYTFNRYNNDRNYRRRNTWINYPRIYEDCFLMCIIQKMGLFTNGIWNYEKIYAQLGGVEKVTKAEAAKCINNSKPYKDNCDWVYKAVKCHFQSIEKGACKKTT